MPHRHTCALSTMIALVLLGALIALPGIAHAGWRTQSVSGAGNQEREGWNVAMTVTSDGNAIAVWEGRVVDGGNLLFSRRVGGTWSAPAAIPGVTRTAGTDVWHPQIAALPNGGAVVVWLQSGSGGGHEVDAVAFDGTHATWVAVESVATGANSEGIAVASDSLGNATAAWVRADGGLDVARRAAGGAWSSTTTFSDGYSRSPSVAVAAATGDATVVWTTDGADHLPYARWTAAGGWSGSTQTIPFPAGFNTPWWSGTAAVADAAGNVMVAWTECRYVSNPDNCHPADPANNAADMRVGSARFDGSSWTVSSVTGGDPVNPGGPIYEGRNPSLGQLPDGSVAAVWAGGEGGTKLSDAVYSSTWTAANGWATPQRLDGTSGDIAAVGFDGGAIATWTNNGGVNYSVLRHGAWTQPALIASGLRGKVVGVAGAPQDGYPVGALVSYATAGSDANGSYWEVDAADLQDLKPGIASVPLVAPADSSSLTISWSAVGGIVPATQYDVAVSDGSSTVGCPSGWDSATTTCTVSGLDLTRTYTVRVRAGNLAGWGPWSDAAYSQTSPSLVYWGNCNDASVSEYRVDGSHAADLVTAAGTGRSGECPWGTAVDVVGNHLYWIDWTGGGPSDPTSKIWMSDLDGSNAHVIYTDGVDGVVIKSVNGLVVDTNQSPAMLYWGNWNGSIGYARADGSGGAGVLFDGVANAQSVVVDDVTSRAYWSRGDSTMAWGNLDGSGTPTTIADSCGAISGIYAIAVDGAANRLYRLVSRSGAQVIQEMALDGSGCQDVASFTASGGATQLTYDSSDNRLYFDWIDWNAATQGTVRYVDLGDPSAVVALSIPGSGATSNGINMPFVVSAPVVRVGTALTADSAAPGATLSCSPASWQGDLTGMNAYRAANASTVSWTRDGTVIPGATGTTLVAATAGTYACVTTGSNVAGSTASVSDAKEIAASASTSTSASGSVATTGGSGGASSGASGVRLGRGGAKQVGNTLITMVDVPAAGTILQVGTVRQGGRSLRVCTARVRAHHAGRFAVRCLLDRRVVRSAARSVRAIRALPLDLTTTFTPVGGGAPIAVHSTAVVRVVPLSPSRVTG